MLNHGNLHGPPFTCRQNLAPVPKKSQGTFCRHAQLSLHLVLSVKTTSSKKLSQNKVCVRESVDSLCTMWGWCRRAIYAILNKQKLYNDDDETLFSQGPWQLLQHILLIYQEALNTDKTQQNYNRIRRNYKSKKKKTVKRNIRLHVLSNKILCQF